MKLSIINNYPIYEHNGKTYLLDTGLSLGQSSLFEYGSQRLPHDFMQRIENAVQQPVDGITNFQSKGRITLTKDSVEIEQNTNVPLPEHSFFLPWTRITQNVPILRMNVNGIDANVIFDTGAPCMFSLYNKQYFQGLTPSGTAKDYLGAACENGAWKDLDAYDDIPMQQGDFTIRDRMLFIPESIKEYMQHKDTLKADVILGVLKLLNTYQCVITDQTGLVLL